MNAKKKCVFYSVQFLKLHIRINFPICALDLPFIRILFLFLFALYTGVGLSSVNRSYKSEVEMDNGFTSHVMAIPPKIENAAL